jgi:hypothetical protein
MTLPCTFFKRFILWDDRVLLGAISTTRLGLLTSFHGWQTNLHLVSFRGKNKSISGGGCCQWIPNICRQLRWWRQSNQLFFNVCCLLGWAKIATAFLFFVLLFSFVIVSSCGVRARRTPPQSFAGSTWEPPQQSPPPLYHSRVMQ